MNRIVRNIPNTITCGNLLCGCLAIVKAFEGNLVWAAYLVGIAAVLDFFDGFAARMLKVSSPIGKDLDSLADMVTFGVVPGVVMYKMLALTVATSFYMSDIYFGSRSLSMSEVGLYFLVPYISFIIPVFSAVRLARFNNDARQTDSFIGLPTPANAVFFCSLPLVIKQIIGEQQERGIAQVQFSISNNTSFWLLTLIVLFSFLLIAPLPLFSLKFKSFSWKGNEIRFTFLILSVALIGFLQFIGIPLVIVLYILMSIVNNLLNRSKKSA